MSDPVSYDYRAYRTEFRRFRDWRTTLDPASVEVATVDRVGPFAVVRFDDPLSGPVVGLAVQLPDGWVPLLPRTAPTGPDPTSMTRAVWDALIVAAEPLALFLGVGEVKEPTRVYRVTCDPEWGPWYHIAVPTTGPCAVIEYRLSRGRGWSVDGDGVSVSMPFGWVDLGSAEDFELDVIRALSFAEGGG